MYSTENYFGHRVYVTISTAYISLSPQYGLNTQINGAGTDRFAVGRQIYPFQHHTVFCIERVWPMKLCLFYPRVLGN